MPVYENTYRPWEGERELRFARILAFPKFAYSQLNQKKWVLVMFMVGWLPFIILTGYIYLCVNVALLKFIQIPANVLQPVGPMFFLMFLLIQVSFMFFFTLAVGPGLISIDMRHRALPMILSKPLDKWEYLLGKFLVLFVILSILSWVQAFLLFIIQTGAVPPASEWRRHFWTDTILILPRAFLFSMVVITTLNLLVLMFSSLTQNDKFAGVAVVMFIIGSAIVAGIATASFHSGRWMVLSPWASVSSLIYKLFSLPNRTEVPPLDAWIYIICLWCICLLILRKRVSAFQIFKE